MGNKLSQRSKGNLMSIIALIIPLIVFLLILNWFFRITPYQKLQGMPILIAPFAGIIGMILGFISAKKSLNSLAKLSIVINSILIAFPFLYWFIGTLIFGV